MSTEKFCLRWNDFETNISSAFKDIRDEKEFFDVTVACEDEQLQAHKVILSACSPFFKNVLRRNQHQHPLLYLKGVSFRDMEAVLNFMYHGEVNVAQDDLNSFLQVAEDLKVKGLTQNNSANAAAPTSGPPNKATVPKSEPKVDLPRPHTTEQEQVHIPKRPRPTPPPPAPRASYPHPEDDIEVIVPVVKSEPRDTTPSMQATNQNIVQQEQVMAMYDVTQQQDTMMEQYDDNYGGDYVEQYDQGYDGSVQGQAGQDAAAAGKVKCAYCDLMMHPGSMNRHIARAHTEQNQLKCTHCGNNYKGEINLKEHLRIVHKVYQNR